MDIARDLQETSLSQSTVCITGSSGYIGQHLVRYLIEQGQKPFLIGRPGMQLQNLTGVAVAQTWSTPAELADQLIAFDNTIVINLAGHFIKNHLPADLPAIIAGNLTYPTLIFEAMALSGITRLINVGTSWEYTDAGLPDPLNMYAAVKKANTLVLDWYTKQYPMRAINLKLNDTYGGEDHRAKLMPLLKQHAYTGEPVQLGYRDQPLNLTYIADVIRAILFAASETIEQPPGNVQEAFVFATETPTLGELVDMIQRITDNSLDVRFKGANVKHQKLRGIWRDAPRLRGWQPETDLDTGLKLYFEKGC